MEFHLDDVNKYLVRTDTRFYTMRDDGGSHDDIYYGIDIEKRNVTKYYEFINSSSQDEFNTFIKKSAQMTKQAVKTTIKAIQVAIKSAISIIKAIILATKALISAIIAGGWVAVVIIVVICLIAMLCTSIFGIFFSNEDEIGEKNKNVTY